VTIYNLLLPYPKECVNIIRRSKRYARVYATLKEENATTSLKMKSNRYADENDGLNSCVLAREYLAVLALQGVTDGKARHSEFIWHGRVGVQECLRSITALLSVHANHSEADTLVQVVVESDTQGEVGAGIKRAGALVVIDGGSSEGVFKDPVGAGLRSLETGAGAVASGVDAILVVEVDHGHNSSDINTLEVPFKLLVRGQEKNTSEI
jgi:hypothetical protein